MNDAATLLDRAQRQLAAALVNLARAKTALVLARRCRGGEKLPSVRQRALEAEATCAVMREAIIRHWHAAQVKATTPDGIEAEYKVNAEAMIALFRLVGLPAPDATTTDAGKLAAEVLRAADAWERETVAFDTDSKRGPSAAWFNAKGALLAAVRARRGAQGEEGSGKVI